MINSMNAIRVAREKRLLAIRLLAIEELAKFRPTGFDRYEGRELGGWALKL